MLCSVLYILLGLDILLIDLGDSVELDYQRNRLLLVRAIDEIMQLASTDNFAKARQVVDDLVIYFKASISAKDEDPRVQGLISDLTGQVTVALDRVQFHRWGKHYLPSLRRAHQLQYVITLKTLEYSTTAARFSSKQGFYSV